MRVALVHYHLKPGGVTRVIEQQAAACRALGIDYCILAGENPLGMDNVITLSELHYDLHRSAMGRNGSAGMLADSIEQALGSCFPRSSAADTADPADPTDIEGSTAAGGTAPDTASGGTSHGSPAGVSPVVDIIHVHNATLAKNSDLLPALHFLRDRGYRLLLQIHDFAEDGRPEVYSSSSYPADVHYAVINSRDGELLLKAGLAEDRLHYLPNQVSPLPGADPVRDQGRDQRSRPGTDAWPSRDQRSRPGRAGLPPGQETGSPTGDGRRLLGLYPVRAIPRKNLGELLLLSLLLPECDLGVTLEPNNPADMPTYRFWVDEAESLGLPLRFQMGREPGFEEALRSADFFVTTSVQEGFGFAFLEPWTLGKPVSGRLIPHLAHDFISQGMKMDWFYEELPIPRDYIDMPVLRQSWMDEATQRLCRFRIALRNQGLDSTAERTREAESMLPHAFETDFETRDAIDFGRLDLVNQARVLRILSSDSAALDALRLSVPALSALPFKNPAIIEHNRDKVLALWSETRYQDRLGELYSLLLRDERSPLTTGLDKEALLFGFLDPGRIFLPASSRIDAAGSIVEIFRRHGRALDPLPVTEDFSSLAHSGPPKSASSRRKDRKTRSGEPFKGLIFDIYGTLVISASGDISLASDKDEGNSRLSPLLSHFAVKISPEILRDQLHDSIHESHRRSREAGIDHPEVDIVKIWASTDGLSHLGSEEIRIFAAEYEALVNPVYPMPGLESFLKTLAERPQLLKGIISNAQFYTPALFPAFLNRNLVQLGFHPDLLVFSYREGRAKPSPLLYETMAGKLSGVSRDPVLPSQCLYIGNDMLNDIWAASQAGFRTVLFAGDGRSLRSRGDDPRCSNLKADYVVTSLHQILDIVDGFAGETRE